MRHFHHLTPEQRGELFQGEPQTVTRATPRALLGRSLGAALYMPATRPRLLEDLRKQYARGCGTLIVCLEDSISDQDLPQGEENVARLLQEIGEAEEGGGDLPLLFLRVRTPAHLAHLLEKLPPKDLHRLWGFALPKFGETKEQARHYLSLLQEVNRGEGPPLYCLPILESPNLAHLESRDGDLLALRNLLHSHREMVLGVRMGATDFSSVYGLRRSPDLTVYDVAALAPIISSIVNIFGRWENGFPLSGGVWEHFVARERLLKPTLRRSPFQRKDEAQLRTELLMEDLDGFIREVLLDKANGLVGKTVIHPTHVNIVNALSIVTQEEYQDAQAVLSLTGGGATGSSTGTKMNEGKPHSNWAQGIMLRAQAFGVLNRGQEFPHVLTALHKQEVEGR